MTENALTIPQQAEKALAFAETKAKLQALAEGSARIVSITNKDGYKECHSARMALKSARVDIQKIAKEARDDALKFQKAVIAKEKELVEIIEPEERRLQALQDEVDRREEAEKQAAAEAERQRQVAINNRFDQVRSAPHRVADMDVAGIEQVIAQVQAEDESTLPEDLRAAMQYEKNLAVAGLRAAIDKRVAWETEQARIKAEREELERLRAEQAAVQAERERLERQAREAEEAAKRSADEAARQAREEEQRRIDAERAEQRRREDEERAEEQRRLADERARVEAERREAERQRAEAERIAREQAIANATLTEAASEALDLLRERGLADHLVTRKLAAALGREQHRAAA